MVLQGKPTRRLAIEPLTHLLHAIGRDVQQPRSVGRTERTRRGEQQSDEVGAELGVGDLTRVQQHQGGPFFNVIPNVIAPACGVLTKPGHAF